MIWVGLDWFDGVMRFSHRFRIITHTRMKEK